MAKKGRIDLIIQEFVRISGQPLVESLVKKALKDAKIEVKFGNMKFERKLKKGEIELLCNSLITVFSEIYGYRLVNGIVKKGRRQS